MAILVKTVKVKITMIKIYGEEFALKGLHKQL